MLRFTLFGILGVVGACTINGSSPGSQLVTTSSIAPGSTCASGGVSIAVGRDVNGDGALEAGEITSTTTTCTPAGVTPQLVETEPEPPGPHCPDGGTAILTGSDTDGDGVLAESEVTSTAYVCDGEASPAMLVRVVPEQPGANCTAGGSAIEVGVDTDGDGTLESNEVQSTTYVCTPTKIIDGDVAIHDAADAAALAGVEVITGTLTISSPTLDSVSLPALRSVGGDLMCGEVEPSTLCNLKAAAFPSLASVGGKLYLFGIHLEGLDLSSLAHAPELIIDGTPVLAVALPALTECNHLQVDGNAASLAIPVLTDCNVALDAGTATTLDAPSLEHGSLSARGTYLNNEGSDVVSISAPVLVSGGIQVADSAVLASVSAPLLQSGFVMLAASVSPPPPLQELSLPLLSGATYFDVSGMGALDTIDVPHLVSVENLVLVNNRALPSCAVDALWTQVGSPSNAILSNNDDAGVCP